jgi:DNA modification methylase
MLDQFQFIGIELSVEYADIARRRIADAVPALFAVAGAA